MIKIFAVLILVISCKSVVNCLPDLTPEAITVYRNPEFFKNLYYDSKDSYDQKREETPSESEENYKYPGETKKPNPTTASPEFEVNYDNSSEFHHEPREVFVGVTQKPKRPKGPYSPHHKDESSVDESLDSRIKEPEQEEEESDERREIEETQRESEETQSFVENIHSDEDIKDVSSLLSPNPAEEFRSYHEPILLAQQAFDPDEESGFARNSYSRPYKFNRTSPLLYEDWKHYTYPTISSNKHAKSDSSLYSEEPASNAFESSETSNYKQDDEAEGYDNSFENNEYKDVGSDTKHIYKKLLKPKKSLSLKFHSKPKHKKLKFKFSKKHFHNGNWFNEYPFDF